MSKSKGLFASRGVGWYLSIIVIILAGVATVLYRNNGINTYSTAYNSKVFLFCWLAIASAALSLCLDFVSSPSASVFVKLLRGLSYLLLLYAALQYVRTQVDFIGAVYMHIDLEKYEPLIPGFVATIACLLLPTVLALAGTCLTRLRPCAKSSEAVQ